jgi:trehalose 6-phosphate synthase
VIRERLDELSGRINGEFADVDWVPIRYVNQGYPARGAGRLLPRLPDRADHARYGRHEPRRQGICGGAGSRRIPGVLILSRFAGAALQLKDALLVNPYSKEEISDAINRALQMPKEERIRRWRSCYESVRDEDVVAWRRAFVEACRTARPGTATRRKEAEA